MPRRRWPLVVTGAVLLFFGTVWSLQGLNVMTQGAMAGHVMWTWIGVPLAVLGLVVGAIGLRRR